MSYEIELLKIIKRAAAEAFEASKPMAHVYGKVTSAAPLTIQVGQALSLGEEHLILTDAVRDHVTELTPRSVYVIPCIVHSLSAKR